MQVTFQLCNDQKLHTRRIHVRDRITSTVSRCSCINRGNSTQRHVEFHIHTAGTVNRRQAVSDNEHFIFDGQALQAFAVLRFFILKTLGLWPSYCRISTDLDKILHTPIFVRNTLVGRLRPRSERGRLQAKPKRLCFCNTCNAP